MRRYPRKFFIWRWQENEENEKANAKRRDMTAMTPQSQHVLPNLILWLQIERQKKGAMIFPVQIRVERVGMHLQSRKCSQWRLTRLTVRHFHDTLVAAAECAEASRVALPAPKPKGHEWQEQLPEVPGAAVPLCCQRVT